MNYVPDFVVDAMNVYRTRNYIVANVGYGYVNAFVFRALYESRKAVVIFTDVYKLPMVLFAYRTKVIDIFGLK